MREEAASKGSYFLCPNKDKTIETLIQIPGGLNNYTGRYEYIVTDQGMIIASTVCPKWNYQWDPYKAMMFTAEYILKRVSLDWADVLWGYRHQLIGWTVPIDLAHARLDSRLTDDDLEIELSQIGKDDDFMVGRIVENLAERNPVPEEIRKRKWIYLRLLWIHENRDNDDDDTTLDKVDDAFADFGYPEEMYSFAPIMAPQYGIDPRTQTYAEICATLLNRLKEYLDRTKLSFS